MLPTTYDAIKSVLRADPSVATPERNLILQSLRNGPTPANRAAVSPQPPGIVRPKTAAGQLSCSVRGIHQLAAEGLLDKVRFPGRQRCAGITTESLNRLLATKA